MSELAHVETTLLEYLRGGVFGPEIVVTEETDLIAHGFDSLSLVALLVFVEQKFGLWLPEREINERTFQNPRALAAVVRRLLHERQLTS